MKNKTVFISGFIGLLFGFLFAGTLGISFFDDNNDSDNPNSELQSGLLKDEESFRLAYNLEESIYVPIYGDDVGEMIGNGDTFILYVGRDTCPYCQQLVPVLQEVAQSKNIDTIYHVDTLDPSNTAFLSRENITSTPITFIIKDGVVLTSVLGYRTSEDLNTILTDLDY